MVINLQLPSIYSNTFKAIDLIMIEAVHIRCHVTIEGVGGAQFAWPTTIDGE